MNDTPTNDRKPTIASVLGEGRSQFKQALNWRNPMSLGVAAFLLIGVVVLLGSWGSGSKASFTTESVMRADLTAIVTATGTVQPTNQVEISSELSGTVRQVLVDFNSTVKIGTLLAELDTDKLKASVASSIAKLASAKAKVINAQATLLETKVVYARKLALAAKQITSEQDADAAKAAADRATASVASAEADVAVAEADLQLAR